MIKRTITLSYEEIDYLIKILDDVECQSHHEFLMKQWIRKQFVNAL